MEIIPVIDLMQGQVVRAKRGERHLYRPIESGLCRGSAPLDMVCALLELYPFKTLYIADLDAILEHGHHQTVISAIRHRFPELDLWLDAGVYHPRHCQAWEGIDLHMVLGSEKLTSRSQFDQVTSCLCPDKTIISLDFSREGFLGPMELLDHASRWPDRVIAMTLAQVGSMQGPDVKRISSLLNMAGTKKIYAAGGVRSLDDLLEISSTGAKGTLVASALHDAILKTADLEKIYPSASMHKKAPVDAGAS